MGAGEFGNWSGVGLSGSRTDGSGLNHVADGETLDGLVLGNAASAVGAAHGLDVAAAVLVATARKSISYHSPRIADRLESRLPFASGNVRQVRWFDFDLSAVCALVVIAEMSNGILLRRWGMLVLLVRPLLDHFDGLFCKGSGCDDLVKWGGRVAYG